MNKKPLKEIEKEDFLGVWRRSTIEEINTGKKKKFDMKNYTEYAFTEKTFFYYSVTDGKARRQEEEWKIVKEKEVDGATISYLATGSTKTEIFLFSKEMFILKTDGLRHHFEKVS